MLRSLKRMVGFFMKREISDLIAKLESENTSHGNTHNVFPQGKDS